MPEPGSEPTLRGYLHIVRRGRWWVAAFSLLGLGISLALSLTASKQYTATAQLLVQSVGSVNLTTGANSNGLTPADVETELQLVTSAQVQSQVRAKLGSAPGISATEVGADQRDRGDRGQPRPGARRADRQRLRQGLRQLVDRDRHQQSGRRREPARPARSAPLARRSAGSPPARPRSWPRSPTSRRCSRASSPSSRWPGRPRPPGSSWSRLPRRRPRRAHLSRSRTRCSGCSRGSRSASAPRSCATAWTTP